MYLTIYDKHFELSKTNSVNRPILGTSFIRNKSINQKYSVFIIFYRIRYRLIVLFIIYSLFGIPTKSNVLTCQPLGSKNLFLSKCFFLNKITKITF